MNELDIATSYGTIHVYKKGNGRKIVILLHGGGCDNAMLSWSEVIQNFNDEYTIYAPDLLGYGKSEKPDGLCGEHFFDVHIQSIKQMTEQLSEAPVNGKVFVNGNHDIIEAEYTVHEEQGNTHDH